jgi:hypothetical protein
MLQGHCRGFLTDFLKEYINTYTAKTENWNKNIPSNENARPHSQFLQSYICERFILSQDWSTTLAAAKQVDRSWEYIRL